MAFKFKYIFSLKKQCLNICIYMYIYVTVNLCNQGIREIPKWTREFANSLKSHEIPETLENFFTNSLNGF